MPENKNGHPQGCQCSDCLPNVIDDSVLNGHDIHTHDHSGLLSFWHNNVAPFYDRRADYNTDSASYYDFLARIWGDFMDVIIPQLNRLIARNITLTETRSIHPTKTGDWAGKPCNCGTKTGLHSPRCNCFMYDDIEDIQEEVKISSAEKPFSHGGTTATLKNGTDIEGSSPADKISGIWSADWTDVINSIIDKNNEQDNAINNINNKIEVIDKFLTQIYNDLINSGGYEGNEGDGHFNGHLATGTINFSTGSNGNTTQIIRTHKGLVKGDYSGGVGTVRSITPLTAEIPQKATNRQAFKMTR